jgi:GcrA cell cycle regulator
MRVSFENMQRGVAVSERAGGSFNRSARAGGGNNQPEDRDALGACARRRLLRERRKPQDAIRKMKIAEPVNIEFLQAERLQDFFAFHCRRPIREVMELSGHNLRVPYSKLFLWVVAQSRLRTQQKINGCRMTRVPVPGRPARLRLTSARPNARAHVHVRRADSRKRKGQGDGMQSTNWTEEQSKALREFFENGMSYSRIAGAINAKFQTAYSRNAAIGRAQRMGLAGSDRPNDRPELPPRAKAPRLHRLRERHAPESMLMMPRFEREETVKLRCVEIDPRHLSLMDLEPGDCRYPYGGDEEGEAITFCGHPQLRGSSYCPAHFHLTSGPGIASERSAGTVSLKLGEAA